jgi:hypothetical protein
MRLLYSVHWNEGATECFPLQTRSKETWDLPLMRLSDRSMMRHSPNRLLIMKTILVRLLACLFLGALAGCGKSSNEQVQTPDPVTQPEAQAALFQRSCDRVKILIQRIRGPNWGRFRPHGAVVALS